MPVAKTSRRKALLAIAFAGGFLGAPSVQADDSSKSLNSPIQEILNNDQISRESRAFFLLRLANTYLANSDASTAEPALTTFTDAVRSRHSLHDPAMNQIVASWANQLSLEAHSEKITNKDSSATVANSSKNVTLANRAIEKALIELGNSSDPVLMLNLYFIASKLYQKAGNQEGMRKCANILENDFRFCEQNSNARESAIKASATVLNAMAYGFVPIEIPEVITKHAVGGLPKEVIACSDSNFKASEKLKLRAAAMADRLPPKSDVRRRAHRDLALWYLKLGKMELAEQEKQTLFELVGVNDDSILYPRPGACGRSLTWWVAEAAALHSFCGRG